MSPCQPATVDMPPIAVEEHWMMPDLTSALRAVPHRDERLVLNEMDDLSRVAGLQRSVSDYVRSNFFITASGMLNPALLRHALSVTTVDRLIFSTDYPFQRPTPQDISSFLGHFSSGTAREKFSSANAASLYGIDI